MAKIFYNWERKNNPILGSLSKDFNFADLQAVVKARFPYCVKHGFDKETIDLRFIGEIYVFPLEVHFSEAQDAILYKLLVQ